jgi:N-acetylneuraminic acid mutarotase
VRSILAIGPGGTVRKVGELPRALSDMAAIALEKRVVLVGGRDASGRVQDSILSVAAS